MFISLQKRQKLKWLNDKIKSYNTVELWNSNIVMQWQGAVLKQANCLSKEVINCLQDFFFLCIALGKVQPSSKDAVETHFSPPRNPYQ